MFDTDRFIDECKRARTENEAPQAMLDIVARAVSEPIALISKLGAPQEAGFQTLFRSDEMTILNLTWAPMMTLMPHDHKMWAVIGIYSGREDNIFWRKNKAAKTIEAVGAKSLMPGTASVLGRDIVHSVTNPISKFSSAIHVYGGDFFAPGRSEWDAESLAERPYDIENARRIFREANQRAVDSSP
jgi:predicted metal-dependent enzyme (double-stranded beta helix superfamily)